MNIYVAQLPFDLHKKLENDLIEKGFVFKTPPYTLFSATQQGLTCTLYQTGKLVIQGKNTRSFVEFYIEPELLQSFDFQKNEDLSKAPNDPIVDHLTQKTIIGTDESGKGDFFGPLCTAGVFATCQDLEKLKSWGVQDSKNLSDSTILRLAKMIKQELKYEVISLFPADYNPLYEKIGNLNTLLAWQHALVIEKLVEETHCPYVLVDQFANESVLLKAVKQRNVMRLQKDLQIRQVTQAERYLAVAAASILARAAFVEGLDLLGLNAGMRLPKGGGNSTIIAGKELLKIKGKRVLEAVSKNHFKNFAQIIATL